MDPHEKDEKEEQREDSYNLTEEVEGNKLALGFGEGERKLLPRIIKNVFHPKYNR